MVDRRWRCIIAIPVFFFFFFSLAFVLIFYYTGRLYFERTWLCPNERDTTRLTFGRDWSLRI